MEGHDTPSTIETWVRRALLLGTLLVALWLRVDRLAEIPIGVDYDEAGNLILAGEVAAGTSRPIFVRAYAGREALFYWLAGASMRLLGNRLFAFRLAAALCGVGTVLLTFALARELFRHAPPLERRWAPLLAAALIATSYWQVHANRYGFRANTMPLLMAATMTLWWRGMRRDDWRELIAAGALCGLSANTYLAIRAFPLVLIPFAGWVVAAGVPRQDAGRNSPRVRARQAAAVGLAALVAVAPLAIFFVRNPQFFAVRMSQASTLEPGSDDLWPTLGRVTLQALGVFTVRGDANPIYNTPGKPIYGPLIGAALYGGLLLCLWRAMRAPSHRRRTPYLLLVLWLPVMLLPNILGARGVPHALRSMGTIPAVYIVPALGLAAALRGVGWAAGRIGTGRALRSLPSWMGTGIVAAVLLIGGTQTAGQYFDVWAHSAGAYYDGSAALRRAAEYLGRWDADEVSLWIGNSTYRHTTYAALCPNYQALRWFNDRTLILPQEATRPALYLFDFTNPLDPLLARYLPPGTLQHRDLGPDGGVGFEAYLVPPDRMPAPDPQFAAHANLGNTVALLGYDLNAPAVSDGVLDITLYWRALRDGERDDYAFFAHLIDGLGFRWGQETFFNYPSLQWRAGDIMIYRKRIPIAAGAPPGDYALALGAFSSSLDARLPLLNEEGQIAGTRATVGPLAVAAAPTPPAELPPMERQWAGHFDGLRLVGTDRDRGDLRPGETLALTLYWRAEAAIAGDYQVSIALRNKENQIALWEGDPAQGTFPFAQWAAPSFVRDRYALRLPTDAPPGDYALRLSLLDADGAPLNTSTGEDAVRLYTIHVKETDRLWEPPPVAHPVGAELGGVVELVGYDLDRRQAAPGQTLHLTLVWRGLAEMDTAYTVFTHLLGPDGQLYGQQDNPPRRGGYPTTLWAPGEIVVDEYAIEIEAGGPAGRYAIEVGMYDPRNVQRLPVRDPSGPADRVLLGAIAIE